MDSRVVHGLARLFRLHAPSVVTGGDMTAELLARHLRPFERITIVGLAPRWLPALVERYDLAPPAHFNPPMGFDRDPIAFSETIEFVRANPARFIFLAVGSPRQEGLAAALGAVEGLRGTGLCIGASLDFLAGAQARAPAAMQRAGLEWLYRLMMDPKRMGRRYLIDSPRIISLLARQVLRSSRTPPA
jgi:exopolysaccharide biosynthesis WecB/TagA/CpsF family protein